MAGEPLGVAEPLKVAALLVTLVAAAVETLGNCAGVVKELRAPRPVPLAFWVTAQKK